MDKLMKTRHLVSGLGISVGIIMLLITVRNFVVYKSVLFTEILFLLSFAAFFVFVLLSSRNKRLITLLWASVSQLGAFICLNIIYYAVVGYSLKDGPKQPIEKIVSMPHWELMFWCVALAIAVIALLFSKKFSKSIASDNSSKINASTKTLITITVAICLCISRAIPSLSQSIWATLFMFVPFFLAELFVFAMLIHYKGMNKNNEQLQETRSQYEWL